MHRARILAAIRPRPEERTLIFSQSQCLLNTKEPFTVHKNSVHFARAGKIDVGGYVKIWQRKSEHVTRLFVINDVINDVTYTHTHMGAREFRES